MKFIFTSLSGSFFKTIGRIFAYIAIGLLIYLLLQFVDSTNLAI